MLVCLGVWLAWVAACGAARLRVLGGADDVHNHFPFAVTIEKNTVKSPVRSCSGSLITQSWVLTAGHCITGTADYSLRFRVRYGDFEKLPNETTKFTKIVNNVRHPHFARLDILVPINDIGLVSVEPVPTLAPAMLSAVDYRCLAGQPGELAGFSPMILWANFERIQDTRPLQVLEVMISSCTEYDIIDGRKTKANICVQGKCGEGSILTHGDSGGPLLHDGRLVAVHSFYVYNAAAACTPISPYISWIQEVVGTKT